MSYLPVITNIPGQEHNVEYPLHGNGPNRLIHVNTWFPVTVTAWEDFGSVALLEELYHLGWDWRLQNTKPNLDYFFPSAYG